MGNEIIEAIQVANREYEQRSQELLTAHRQRIAALQARHRHVWHLHPIAGDDDYCACGARRPSSI